MTPEEARKFLGLPDVAPLQQEMQARMKAALESGDSEALMRAWMLAGGAEAFERFQKLLWDSARNMTGKG